MTTLLCTLKRLDMIDNVAYTEEFRNDKAPVLIEKVRHD